MTRWLNLGSSLSMRQTIASLAEEGAERTPMRALGTTLVTAIVALATLLSPSVALAQFDFTLTTQGPRNVVQGRPLYFVLTATPVAGTSPTVIPIAVTGLPGGATVSFPDIAQTCCGTNQIWSLPASTTIQINTLATTPVGPATLTVSVTAGTVSRSVSYAITVTPPPNPFSRQPYAAASSVPQLALWQSNMTTYGQTFCAQLSDPSFTVDQKIGATYYDSQRVFYNIRDYTGTSFWDTCAQKAQAVYRDAYVIPNKGGVPGYWDFPHGLYQSHVRTGDAASKNAVLLLSKNAAFGTNGVGTMNYMVGPAVSRELSYNLMAYLLARAVGQSQSPVGEAYVDLVLGHIDQWFVSKTFRAAPGDDVPPAAKGQFYLQPFMVALTAEALIQLYEAQPQDVRIATAVKLAMDWLWANAWDASNQAFWYELYGPAVGPYQKSSPSGAPDLNLLIAPAFAWLYKQTGDTTYRDRADAIFAGGVTGACVSCDGKHFNQQYRWSFDYVKWRNPTSVPTAPTGLIVR
jgi:hypothetical protein